MATYAVTNPDQYFYLHGGGSLRSIEELFAELQTMDQTTFRHHVNQQRNDFASWVRDVMDDRFLAKNIELTQDRDQMLKLLFMNLFR